MTYDLQNHTYIFNIYIYIHIWYGGMCISNTNDNVWHWWRYRSLLLFPLLCCWCHSLAPQDQAPFPPTSQLSYKHDCWWGSWVKWLQLTSWLHTTKTYVSDMYQESCVSVSVSGSRWKVSSGLIPKREVRQFDTRGPTKRNTTSKSTHVKGMILTLSGNSQTWPPSRKSARGQSKIQVLLERPWESWDVYIYIIYLKEFRDEWPWTGVCP